MLTLNWMECAHPDFDALGESALKMPGRVPMLFKMGRVLHGKSAFVDNVLALLLSMPVVRPPLTVVVRQTRFVLGERVPKFTPGMCAL